MKKISFLGIMTAIMLIVSGCSNSVRNYVSSQVSSVDVENSDGIETVMTETEPVFYEMPNETEAEEVFTEADISKDMKSYVAVGEESYTMKYNGKSYTIDGTELTINGKTEVDGLEFGLNDQVGMGGIVFDGFVKDCEIISSDDVVVSTGCLFSDGHMLTVGSSSPGSVLYKDAYTTKVVTDHKSDIGAAFMLTFGQLKHRNIGFVVYSTDNVTYSIVSGGIKIESKGMSNIRVVEYADDGSVQDTFYEVNDDSVFVNLQQSVINVYIDADKDNFHETQLKFAS